MNKSMAYGWLVCFLFIVYGSLVPLDFKNIPFEQAYANFKNIRYLNLGIESRADWVANILLYIPLSFLSLGSLRFLLKNSFFYKIIFSILVFGFCIATAVSVEFVQQFFPPRTVSLNDLIAETIGTVIGMALWFSVGEKIIVNSQQMIIGNWLSIKSAIILYLPVYLFLSLFPFDFVTSINELQNKLATGSDSFFININGCLEEPFRCFIKRLIEILVLVPLGGLFAALPYTPNRKSLAIVVGFLLGVVIEFTQLFIYSGSAQGFSIITRMLGMALGIKAYDFLSGGNLKIIKPWLGWIIGLFLIPYFLTLAAINGWIGGRWISVAQVQLKLSETHFLPFYYFYYTTETVALVSLLSNIGMYMPIGFLFWLYRLKNSEKKPIHSFWVGLTSAILSVVMEVGKLFLQDKHVDPTDILIAYIAGAGTYAILNKIQALYEHPSNHNEYVRFTNANGCETVSGTPSSYAFSIEKKWLLPAGLIGMVIVYKLIQYPIKPVFLAIFVLGYCYAILKKPLIGLFVLPALLPLMDFAPWTGRFFFDEFDLIILSTLMVLIILPRANTEPLASFRLADYFFIGLFVLLLSVSLIIGLMPFPAIDANSFSNYYSHYNALRIVKGFLWGLLFSPYLIRSFGNEQARNYFAGGLLIGLIGLAIFSIVERWVFTDFFDFSTDYRINGLFSTMHTGGGHIESYLALTMPFIALLVFREKQSIITKVAGILLFILALYTLLMTFSRGGAIGVAVSFLVLLIGFYIHFVRQNRLKGGSLLLTVSLSLLIVTSLAIPVLTGDLMKSRIDVAAKDKEIRDKHWITAIDMMDSGFLTKLFGMGLGSFPRTFYWSNQENAHPATYRIGAENGNQYLALQGGDALFMGQYVSLRPHQLLKLGMDVRSPQQNATLSVPICEKSLQYSFRCVSAEVNVPSTQWQHIEKEIDSDDVGLTSPHIAGGWLTRPVQLALYAGGDMGKIIEVDNLSLRDEKGENLIANGNFSDGADRWYFSTEKHNPWHIFNIWVHVLFDMGWFGLCAFILLIAYVYYRLLKSIQHDVYAPVLLSAFTGFLIIGYVDSPFDAPRLSFLFLMLVIFAIFGCKRPDKSLKIIRHR